MARMADTPSPSTRAARAPSRAPAWLRGLPNALTVLRLLLAAAFPFLAPGGRLPVALAAGCSDGLDGWIARRFHVQTRLGALLDGVADKAFVLAVLGTLLVHAEVAWWQVALVLLRDAVVAVTLLSALLHSDVDALAHVQARLPGKLTTALLFGWFGSLFLAALGSLAPWLFWAAAACSAWAACDYGLRGARALRKAAVSGRGRSGLASSR